MHIAALINDAEGIQLLLKYGADKDVKSEVDRKERMRS
jgi:hypothetical protein